MLPIVDTHQHLWDLSQFTLPWLESDGVEMLRKDHLMRDYLETSANANVARTVYMEVDVAPADRLAEAQFVTGLCRRDDNPMAGAVIGGRPGEVGFREYISQFKNNHFIKGVRQVLHVPDTAPGYSLNADFVKGVQYLGESDMIFDLCLRPGELADAVGLVNQCPDTYFILDHCGTPLGIACYEGKLDENFERWRGSIRELAQCENVTVKLGGLAMPFCMMPAEGPTDSVSSEELADMWRPYVETCIEAFGPQRAMFESNYPVDKWAGSYATLWNALKRLASGASAEEKRALFAGNAARVYRVENLLGLT